jgi:alkaline phosphatase
MNSRRSFLASVASLPIAAAGCAHGVKKASPQAATTVTPSAAGRPQAPRHIVHLVADGTSMGMLSLANHFSEQHRGRSLTWFQLYRDPESQVALMDMRSQDSLVTDSAAASSSWGSGVRIPNGKLNQTSKGTSLTTLYELVREAGWKRGLVTTTEITHATPAGFAVSIGSRNISDDIAAQYFDRRIDLMLGGGRDYFAAEKRKDKRDLRGEFKAAGYAVLQSPAELKRAPDGQPWIGLFSGGHLPFLVDQVGGITPAADVPSLAGMTRSALHHFRSEPHFILQVEGGRVDHGCHNNDAAAAIRELVAFDEALDVCLEFQREVPDTLLVITTDHSTANPGLNGMGDNYTKSPELFRHVDQVKQSVPEILKRLRLAESQAQAAAVLASATGYLPSTRRLAALDPFLKKKGYSLFDGENSDISALSLLLANHLGISFTSTAHTSDLVPVVAVGPGSDRFRGLIRNTEVFDHYLDFARIQFRNPQEPLIAGGSAPSTDSAERVHEYLLA